MQAACLAKRIKIACIGYVQCWTMAGAVVMGHRLVGVALRLISIAIFMYDAGAIHHNLPGNLARMDRRRQHKGRRDHDQQEGAEPAQHVP